MDSVNKEYELFEKLNDCFNMIKDGWKLNSFKFDVEFEKNGEKKNFVTKKDLSNSDANKSETPEVKAVEQMNGGYSNKNVFKSSKYSETSSVNATNINNLSKTSDDLFNNNTDKYSETSVLGQNGGGMETSDTLQSVSELNYKKTKNNSNSNLDVNIFKKTQRGGSVNTAELKKKMMDLGINSSSSNICD